MLTGAALATVNRLPVLLLPGDVFATRPVDPVLQQLEAGWSRDVSVNDAFKPVSRYWDRINRPEQLGSALLEAMRVLTDPAETGAVTLRAAAGRAGRGLRLPGRALRAARLARSRGRRPTPARSSRRAPTRSGRPARAADRRRRRRASLATRPTRCARSPSRRASRSPRRRPARARCPRAIRSRSERSARPARAPPTWSRAMPTSSSASARATPTSRRPRAPSSSTRTCGSSTSTSARGRGQARRLRARRRRPGDARAAHVRARRPAASRRRTASASTRSCASGTREVDRLVLGPDDAPPTQAQVIGAVNDAAGATRRRRLRRRQHAGRPAQALAPRAPDGYHVEYGYSCMGYEVAGGLGVRLAEPDARSS